MPDYSAPNALPEFAAAATQAEPSPPQATATLQLDADVLAWFQKNQPNGMTWQQDMASVLRSHMDYMTALEASAPEPVPAPDFIPF